MGLFSFRPKRRAPPRRARPPRAAAAPAAVAGEGRACWGLVDAAAARRRSARLGAEDRALITRALVGRLGHEGLVETITPDPWLRLVLVVLAHHAARSPADIALDRELPTGQTGEIEEVDGIDALHVAEAALMLEDLLGVEPRLPERISPRAFARMLRDLPAGPRGA